jgi:hypothetical protein
VLYHRERRRRLRRDADRFEGRNEMKRRRLLTVLVPLGLAAVVFFVVLGGGGAFGASSAGAGGHEDGDGHGCNLASLKGPYAYNVTGAVFAPSGAEVADIAAVGLAVSDGKGHVTGHDWASQNGVTTPRTLTATYTVDSDCTGMVHIVFTPGGPVDAFFVLAQGGRVFKVIQTDTGAVVSGDGVRQ